MDVLLGGRVVLIMVFGAYSPNTAVIKPCILRVVLGECVLAWILVTVCTSIAVMSVMNFFLKFNGRLLRRLLYPLMVEGESTLLLFSRDCNKFCVN